MTLKTYQAATMAEALAQVKKDLGRNAVILHTRSFRRGGLMGLIGGRSMWEVTASPHANVPMRGSNRPSAPRVQATGEYFAQADGSAPVATRTLTERTLLTASTGLSDEEFHDVGIEEIDAELAKLLGPPSECDAGILPACPEGVSPSVWEDGVSRQQRRKGEDADGTSARHADKMSASRLNTAGTAARHADKMSASRPDAGKTPATRACAEFHAHLLRQDVDEEIAKELIDELRLSLAGSEPSDSKMIADRLCDLIAARIQVADPAAPEPRLGKPHVIALIGPTGVGKTTTLAKLAANYKLQHRLRVGLVTLDTYRIAAVEQLRTYAEIIEVPLRTVISAGELHQAVHGMEDVDVVLIDTAGRSQNDQPRLNELRAMVAASGADEVHLLISATSSRRTARNILHRFGPLGATRIVLTKLDEAETFGTILSLSAEPDAPLSFVTTGQDVPDDIEPADPWQLAQRVLKGR